MVKTAVLVSGGGTNLQALIDATLFGELKNCELTAVLSSTSGAYAIQRANSASIPVFVIERELFPNNESYNEAIANKLQGLDIELVILAGFAPPLLSNFINRFKYRIINTLPTLMPAFCGLGIAPAKMYEHQVGFGVKYSGATVYFVIDEGDVGPIILQKAVELTANETADSLQRRITDEAESLILPRAVSLLCEDKLSLDGNIVRISE